MGYATVVAYPFSLDEIVRVFIGNLQEWSS